MVLVICRTALHTAVLAFCSFVWLLVFLSFILFKCLVDLLGDYSTFKEIARKPHYYLMSFLSFHLRKEHRNVICY